MSRLIDVEALPTSIENMDLEVAEKIVEWWMQDAPCDISWDAVRVLRDFYDEVKDAPTIDAVEVVRCKDCKHKYIENMTWHCPFGLMGGEDFFCGYGSLGRAERRNDED